MAIPILVLELKEADLPLPRQLYEFWAKASRIAIDAQHLSAI
jgi:hypothetical protein